MITQDVAKQRQQTQDILMMKVRPKNSCAFGCSLAQN